MAVKKIVLPVVVWYVSLNDGDWYAVFARTKNEAVRIVRETHYDMCPSDFRHEFEPYASQCGPRYRIKVNTEKGQITKTARAWAKGEKPGPFISNTYDI